MIACKKTTDYKTTIIIFTDNGWSLNILSEPCFILLEQLYKFIKDPILIGISSNFLHNISTCICIRKNYKNGEFSPSHFWQNLANDPVL